MILIVETFANATTAVWENGSKVDDEKLGANICFHSWPHHFHGFGCLSLLKLQLTEGGKIHLQFLKFFIPACAVLQFLKDLIFFSM